MNISNTDSMDGGSSPSSSLIRTYAIGGVPIEYNASRIAGHATYSLSSLCDTMMTIASTSRDVMITRECYMNAHNAAVAAAGITANASVAFSRPSGAAVPSTIISSTMVCCTMLFIRPIDQSTFNVMV
jgi:hypothetical protein